MKIYTNILDFKKPEHPVLTMGTFDGLHLGHQRIIQRMKSISEENGGETVLLTFDPHPRHVIDGNADDLKFILTKERKFYLLEKFGIDHLIVIHFDQEFAEQSAEEFVKKYLVDRIGVKDLIIGYDHHFGKGRGGSLDVLADMGNLYGFNIEKIEAASLGEITISSTKIRTALQNGQIKLANEMLGYHYSITGTVVKGNEIGRTIGFPTANIECKSQYKLIAAGGVYACKVEWRDQVFLGMGNIGYRPTIGDSDLVTEVHIFDFDEDIYHEEITVYFIDRIRDEVKFQDLNALRNQLMEDKVFIRAFLG